MPAKRLVQLYEFGDRATRAAGARRQLEVLLEFVQASLTPATLEKWRRALTSHFIGPVGPYAGVWTQPTSQGDALSLQQLRRLQADAAVLLNEVVETRDPGWTDRHAMTWVNVIQKPMKMSVVGPRGAGGGVMLFVGASAPDTFRYIVVRLIEQVGLDRLFRCPNTTCRRLFLKNGRRAYCSTRCQTAVYMRRYRAS